MEGYEIIKPLGSDGNCNAFLGKEIESGQLVTIKRCKSAEGELDEIEKKNLFNESRVLEGLDHEAIPKLYKRSPEEIVLEYVPGNSLEKVLLTKGTFAEKDALRIAYELAGIMRYLHGRRSPIIYRDLKPANIVMKPDGHVSLIDYGAARFYERGERADTLNLGTLGFAAPEQFGYLGQTDPRTDIFCFGMTLLQLVSGVDTRDMDAVVNYKKNGVKGISQDLLGIVEKCTRADREDRFRSFKEIQEELGALPKRKKLRKIKGALKVMALASCLSLIISAGIIKGEELTDYATADMSARLPAVRIRLGYARLWIENYLFNENDEVIDIE
ncbi:MAG: serine/threonine protein kinase [Butyrivibrio sp.]|uniref:serine/threonine protein kinase n=1 Tax=Butyrivibrio sp. TaxID=28121 RepID=UPI0025BCC7EE|nr:serine/threonine-protein kinase [Butyrivibrio sp.]MBQ6589137.1 serine/threonine protein kinase [Butyrivibrio sp.]